jgi:hypothetical protein
VDDLEPGVERRRRGGRSLERRLGLVGRVVCAADALEAMPAGGVVAPRNDCDGAMGAVHEPHRGAPGERASEPPTVTRPDHDESRVLLLGELLERAGGRRPGDRAGVDRVEPFAQPRQQRLGVCLEVLLPHGDRDPGGRRGIPVRGRQQDAGAGRVGHLARERNGVLRALGRVHAYDDPGHDVLLSASRGLSSI